jgi:hypothetical protein
VVEASTVALCLGRESVRMSHAPQHLSACADHWNQHCLILPKATQRALEGALGPVPLHTQYVELWVESTIQPGRHMRKREREPVLQTSEYTSSARLRHSLLKFNENMRQQVFGEINSTAIWGWHLGSQCTNNKYQIIP